MLICLTLSPSFLIRRKEIIYIYRLCLWSIWSEKKRILLIIWKISSKRWSLREKNFSEQILFEWLNWDFRSRCKTYGKKIIEEDVSVHDKQLALVLAIHRNNVRRCHLFNDDQCFLSLFLSFLYCSFCSSIGRSFRYRRLLNQIALAIWRRKFLKRCYQHVAILKQVRRVSLSVDCRIVMNDKIISRFIVS